MTSPDNATPTVSYTKSTVHTLQDVDQAALAGQKNADMRGWAESARGNLFTNLLGGFLGIGDFLSTIVGAFTGGLFFDLGGASTWGTGLTTKVDQTKASLEYEVPRLDNRIDQLANGDSIYTFTSSGTFTKPPNAKRIGIGVIGGGDGGYGGPKADTGRAPGGTNGSYVFKWFDAALVPSSLAVTIGAAGSGGPGRTTGLGTNGPAQAGSQGTATTVGSLLTSLNNGLGIIVSEEGILSAALTAPGSGGSGGEATSGTTAGLAGGSTGWKSGGAGSSTGQGGTGQSIDIDAGDPFSGGGGGGGGASVLSVVYSGFRGGNGGWPGSAGGGGGAGSSHSSASSGAGGNAAAGAARIIVKYS